MVYPPMQRSTAVDLTALRLARHKANALMMAFEKRMAAKQHHAAAAAAARICGKVDGGASVLGSDEGVDDAMDWEAALDSLIEARMAFASAKDEAMVGDLEAMVARLQVCAGYRAPGALGVMTPQLHAAAAPDAH